MGHTENPVVGGVKRPDGNEPTPTYNPRTLIEWATDNDAFLSALPPVVSELAIKSNEEIYAIYLGEKGDVHASLAMKRMRDAAKELATGGAASIQFSLLGEFFDSREEISEINFGRNRSLSLDAKLALLPPAYRQEWEERLISGELRREQAPRVLQAVTRIYSSPYEFPGFIETEMPEVFLFHQRMERVPHELVLHVLPDITDAEAAQVFYEGVTAREVYDIAAGRSFVR